MQTVCLRKNKSINSPATLQICPADWMPPGVHYLGIWKGGSGTLRMYGYGEASPKWKKRKCL